LQPKGAIEKSQLPDFLSTWVDKTSPQVMYSVGQIRSWLLPHLKIGCWYIDCNKGFYPKEEEELKAEIDAEDSASGSAPATEEANKDNDDDGELANMSVKERKKEIARRALGKEKEKKKKEKAKKALVKAGKKPEGSSRKSKDADAAKSAGDIVPESTPTTLLSGSLKRNATFAGLSISKM
jgi:hypothetical protein